VLLRQNVYLHVQINSTHGNGPNRADVTIICAFLIIVYNSFVNYDTLLQLYVMEWVHVAVKQ
jgi:hypothetical protein